MRFEVKKEVLLVIGMFSLIITLILDIFTIQEPIVDFFSGLFIGLSLATNIGFLLKFRNENYKKSRV